MRYDTLIHHPLKEEWERIEAIRLTLNVLASILEAYDITYWLNGGTLLGALRHCDLIPWDTDGDVMVPYRKGCM